MGNVPQSKIKSIEARKMSEPPVYRYILPPPEYYDALDQWNCCYTCKCPMVHHRSTNCCCFRRYSIAASHCCESTARCCVLCEGTMYDTSYLHVERWTRVTYYRNGSYVVDDSDRDNQLAGQAFGQCIFILCFLGGLLMFISCTGLLWLMSSPGLCCGNNEIPPNPDMWMDRCNSKDEIAFRFFTGHQRTCSCCCCFPCCFDYEKDCSVCADGECTERCCESCVYGWDGHRDYPHVRVAKEREKYFAEHPPVMKE